MATSKFIVFASSGLCSVFFILTMHLEEKFSQKTAVAILLRVSFIIFFACIPTFGVMTLAGCISSSPAIPNIFLAKLRQGQNDNFELRVGYYGVCASQNKQVACFPTPHTAGASSRLSSSIAESFDNTASMDSLIALAFPLQSVFQQTLPTALTIYLAGIISSLVFMLAYKVFVKKGSLKAFQTAKNSRNVATGCFWGSTALTLAAAISVTQAQAAIQFATSKMADSTVQVSRGVTLEIFQWFIFAFSFLFACVATVLMSERAKSGPPPPPKPTSDAATPATSGASPPSARPTASSARPATSAASPAAARAAPARAAPARAVPSRQQ